MPIEHYKGLEICISTDKPEMLSVSSKINLVKRPIEISDNKSQITPSILHALKKMEYEKKKIYEMI